MIFGGFKAGTLWKQADDFVYSDGEFLERRGEPKNGAKKFSKNSVKLAVRRSVFQRSYQNNFSSFIRALFSDGEVLVSSGTLGRTMHLQLFEIKTPLLRAR